MGYYDENGLWIEDGQRYIFKPGSTPEGVHAESSEQPDKDPDDWSNISDEKASDQQVLWKNGAIAE